MQEREQLLYMQVRIMRMAALRWHKSMAETAEIFRRQGLATLIEENYEAFHTEGDEAIYAEVMETMKSMEEPLA